MELPSDVAAYGWVPFVAVILLSLIFSWFYIRFYQSLYESELSSTITATFALTVALLTIFLVPVDVFLISYMKTSDGEYKPWANDSAVRQSYENTVLYGYYALYICLLLFLFFIIPFVYFFYEENDEELFTHGSRIRVAIRYTVFFVLAVGILLLIGAFIPFKLPPPSNSTTWEKFHFIFNEIEQSKAEDALSFIFSILSLIGMLLLIIYTGFGMASLPFGLIKGSQNLNVQHDECSNRKVIVEAKINAIKDKYRNGRPMRSRDRRELEVLLEEERLMERQVNFIERESQSWYNKCCFVFRPFEIVLGICFCLLGFLIFLALLLSSIDKAMHSYGYEMGFLLPNSSLPNPVDDVFVFTQRVFPLDYVLFSGIVLFLVFCSMSGIRQLGIWFLWIRMFRIRPHRTRPQGLLLLCVTLMLIILALNIVLYSLTPQYTMFGNQHFKSNLTLTAGNVMLCTTAAPIDECQISRMSFLLTQFFYKAWFFGVAYYFGIWAFLLAIIIGSAVCFFRKPQSWLDGAATSDDFEESDDDLLPA